MKGMGNALVLAGGALTAASCVSPQEAPRRPNVVFILAEAHTPNPDFPVLKEEASGPDR